MQLGGDFWEIAGNISLGTQRNHLKSPLVFTCQESCIGERGKNCIKNRMCKQALKLSFLQSK